jgi:hypothetical protein
LDRRLGGPQSRPVVVAKRKLLPCDYIKKVGWAKNVERLGVKTTFKSIFEIPYGKKLYFFVGKV